MKQPKPDMPVTMTIRDAGKEERIERKLYSAPTTRIEWVSVEKDASGAPLARRTPRPKKTVYSAVLGFFAAGRHYASWRELVAEHDDGYRPCRDKYGRETVYNWERFPCFDSYDYAHEDRYRRWFFLREGDQLTGIYLEDHGAFIEVTEDVQDLEWQCLDRLRERGLVHTPS